MGITDKVEHAAEALKAKGQDAIRSATGKGDSDSESRPSEYTGHPSAHSPGNPDNPLGTLNEGTTDSSRPTATGTTDAEAWGADTTIRGAGGAAATAGGTGDTGGTADTGPASGSGDGDTAIDVDADIENRRDFNDPIQAPPPYIAKNQDASLKVDNFHGEDDHHH